MLAKPIFRVAVGRPPLISLGVAGALVLMVASIAVVARLAALGNRSQRPSSPDAAAQAPASAPVEAAKPPAGGKRFTLRLGQGFRFKDGAVVAGNDDAQQPDVVFKYLPPHVGGMATRYNPVSQQVEVGLEPTLTAPMPLLLSAHIAAFDARPDVARTTSGDIATYANQAPIATTTRYLLLMTAAGDQYLLTLDDLEAPAGRYDDWRIGFAYEPVQLPVGLAGGRVNKPLPGRLVFRDWYRSKMIVRVDLTSGKEEPIADGILPSAPGKGLLAYADVAGAYVVRDAAGKVLHTVRFNEQVLGPVLSPDGTRLVGSVYRPGPGTEIAGVTVPGAAVLSAGVFDLAGREVTSVLGYDDATWAPDGKLVATGTLTQPGVFEIDPATGAVRPIDAAVAAPFQPCVSPDGRTVAFVTGNKVWLIGRDGTDLRQLLPDRHAQQRPAFSPDGTKVAMVVCNTMAGDTTGEVFVVDLKTGDLTPLRTSTGTTLVPDPSTRLNWLP